ncbi:MAG: hypothetical protein M3Q51_09255, partial [Pseudomonadota bacterium]|nr:hypothetical protein [Pseudomonadota bacterium]
MQTQDASNAPPATETSSGVPGRPAIFGWPAWTWSLIALALGIALSYWAAALQQRRVDIEQHRVLTQVTENGYGALVDQLHACTLLARAVQTLFLTSGDVDAA